MEENRGKYCKISWEEDKTKGQGVLFANFLLNTCHLPNTSPFTLHNFTFIKEIFESWSNINIIVKMFLN